MFYLLKSGDKYIQFEMSDIPAHFEGINYSSFKLVDKKEATIILEEDLKDIENESLNLKFTREKFTIESDKDIENFRNRIYYHYIQVSNINDSNLNLYSVIFKTSVFLLIIFFMFLYSLLGGM